jgi:hypothetical protein
MLRPALAEDYAIRRRMSYLYGRLSGAEILYIKILIE